MIIQLNEIKIKVNYLEEKCKIIAQEKNWENSYAGELRKYFMLFNMACKWIWKNLNVFAIKSQTLNFSHSKSFAIFFPNIWDSVSFYGGSSGMHCLFNEYS